MYVIPVVDSKKTFNRYQSSQKNNLLMFYTSKRRTVNGLAGRGHINIYRQLQSLLIN
jgi:hypothetical protein